ncbi:hypothetical protein [Streptomyces beihaiensis]|uniref:Uncharacterized protein n=1 Tax=Streptomyces beihaiensis TaxID=2984495 RepID=A0ABT3TYL2_9ACTN|nr:hypothetical protein [Streptomyces beihaiensis]MCX3061482.1 hypothetical protein [Streptomyces beihaiensis]
MTVPTGVVVASVLDGVYGLPWWQRCVAVVLTAFVLEAVHQAVRRSRRGKDDATK